MPDIHEKPRSAANHNSLSVPYTHSGKTAKTPVPSLPMYRVIPAGKAFYHVVEIATNRVIGYRRLHADACALARHLETPALDEQPRIRANSGA